MKPSKEITITWTEALLLLGLCNGKTRQDIMQERGITSSTWYTHIEAVREKLTGGWREEAPAVLSMSRQITLAIEELIAIGKNPLVQSDVISSRALMAEILKKGQCRPCDAQVSQGLKAFGMDSVGRLLLVGERHCLWALPGIDRVQAAGRIHARIQK